MTRTVYIYARDQYGVFFREVLCLSLRPCLYAHRQSYACAKDPEDPNSTLRLNLLVPRCNSPDKKIPNVAASKCVRDLPDEQFYQQEKKKRAKNISSLPSRRFEPFQTRAGAPPCIPRNRRRSSSRLGAGAAAGALLLVHSGRRGFGRL